MSSVEQTLHEFPDLFCELYDQLDEQRFRKNVSKWLEDKEFGSTVIGITGELERGDTTPDRLRLRTNFSDHDRQRLACLIALDTVFGHLRPETTQPVPPGMARLAAQVEVTGRLDSDSEARKGALLPRVVVRSIPGQAPDHKRDMFHNVIRVTERAWRMGDFRVLGEAARLQRHEVQRGLKVACAPLIASPSELEFHTRRRGRRRVYSIAPAGLPATQARIAEVVDAFHASGAIVGVAPELTLTRDLLTCWREALCARSRAHLHGALLWVLVGSGDIDGSDPPANASVLLDARSGTLIARQDKLYPFNLDALTLKRWKLDAYLGPDPVNEDLRRGEQLTILEAGGGVRLAVLVCEDAGRAQDLGPVVRDFGVSHILAPVFSRPIKPHRWEEVAAATHVRETGSTVVVANSLVMHSILGGEQGGTALATWPGTKKAVIDQSRDPAQPVCFMLGRDGTAALR